MKKLHTNLFAILLAFLFTIPSTFSQDCFYCTASSENASNGSQTCVDVSVHGFNDISSFQFSLVWDPNVLSYSHVENVNLPIPLAAQFGTPLISVGVLTFFWLDTTQGHDVPDRTVAFSACFDVIGMGGTTTGSTDVSFTSDATPIEVYDSDLNLLDFHAIAGTVVVDGAPVGSLFLEGCEISNNCMTELDLVVEGGVDPLTYNWAGPNSFSSSNKDLVGVIGGTYDLTVTDDNGLSITESFDLGALVPEITGVSVVGVDCAGFNNGAINLTVEGGLAPVEFLWSNGSNFEDLSGLSPGDYTITITDAGGCEIIETYTVLGNAPIELVSLEIDCETDAGNDGFVTLEVMGGSGNYSFDWSFGGSTSTGVYGGLPAGDYDVSVTDEFNCPYIIIPFGISGGITAANDFSVCAGQSIAIGVEAASGETFSWSPATFLSCTDCPNPIATPDSDMEYYVSVVDTGGCVDYDTLMVTVVDDCVWPGDTDRTKEVSHFDLLNIGLGAGEVGATRMNNSTDWSPKEAMNWGLATPISDIDFKYADTNGDGLVDAMDTLAIADNWGEMHNFKADDPHKFQGEKGEASSFRGGVNFSVNAPDTLLHNSTVSLPIELGDMNNEINALYGLAFSVSYDPSVVVGESVVVELTGSWLGSLGADLIMMQKNDPMAGRIDVAITGMDQVNRSGFGQIALLNFDLQSINGSTTLNLGISNEKLITNIEEEVIVAAANEMVTIVDVIASVYALELEKPFEVFPNPAKNIVYLDPGTANIERIDLFDLTGRRRSILKASVDQKTLYMREGMTGSFMLRIQTDQGLFVRRLVLME